MKDKALPIAAAALILVIGGAYLLYDKLSEGVSPDNLGSTPQSSAVSEPESSDSSEPKSSDTSESENSDTSEPENSADSEEEKITAPDVTLYNADGTTLQLSEFFGKPIVLNFWASWCGPCRSEMPAFDAACTELEDEVQFIMLNCTDGQRETVETAAAFISEQGYTFPVYYDIGQTASDIYGASSLPTTFFIDAGGHAVAYARGAIDAETLQKGLALIK